MAGGRRQIVLACAAACLTCGTTGQPPPAHAFPVRELTLPSGLKLVIEQDDVSPIAGIVVNVDVGSVDDPTGKHGTAHVLEHLVFRVHDEGERSLWSRLVHLGASSFNASTGIELTTYHAFGPRQTLDDLVALMLGRLADPLHGATESDVAKEVSITAEEVRTREGAGAWEYLFPSFMPAGDPVGRAYSELRRSDKLSLADVRAFADAFYRPERMTVVISGPIPEGWEKALVAKLPASLHGQGTAPGRPIRRPTAPFAGPARPETDLAPRTAKVNAPELWMAWRVPPALGVEARKAGMIAYVIERVVSSRLDPDGTNDVLDVNGFAFTGGLSTFVGCRFKLRSADDALRIRNETKAALEALSDATLVRIKGRLYWSHVHALQAGTLTAALEMDTVQGRALARAELAHAGASAHLSSVIGALEKVTSDDITDYAARYLKPDAARSVLVVPEDGRTARRRTDDPDGNDRILAPGTESERDTLAIKDDEEDLPDRQALLATIQSPGARAAQVRKLSNGLTVIAMRRPGLPFASMLLGFHADPQPTDAPGARYAYQHTLRWELSEGPLARGLLPRQAVYDDQAQERLRMFSTSVSKALDFLSEKGDSVHVFWPNPNFERWLDARAIGEATPEGVALRSFRTALFGSHPYHLSPTTAEARKVTEQQIRAWLERVRRPANGALVVVGEIDPENVFSEAQRMLHGWKGDPTPPPAPPAPPSRFPAAPHGPPDVVVVGSGARTVQTADARRRTTDVRFGCFLPPVRTPRDQIIGDLLSSLVGDGLASRLRWKLAITYGPRVTAESQRGGTSWLSGQLDVDGRSQAEALDMLHAWFDENAAVPIEAKRFEQVRWHVARRSGVRNATGQQMASSLFEAWNMDWEPAVLDDYPRDLAGVTIADVTSALAICRRSAVISVLGPNED